MIFAPNTRPIVLNGVADTETKILREYADFWKIPYQITPSHDLPLFSTTDNWSPESADVPMIVSPTVSGAEEIAKSRGLQISHEKSSSALAISEGASLSIEAETYRFAGQNLEAVLRSGDTILLSRFARTRKFLLSLDLVGKYSRLVYGGLTDTPSWKFRTATKLPFSYQSIPKFIRNRSFRAGHSVEQFDEKRMGPVEFLRTLFLASLVIAIGSIPRVGLWKKGKSYAAALTHDVETQQGLEQGAPQLLAVERELKLSSTWNVPSNRYPIKTEALKEIGKSGEIGGHDTRHDGRLVLLETSKAIERLQDCKSRLEQLSQTRVRGFRAPLLQHSPDLLSAESSAGFDYDSSCPSWEILSPTSLVPHGVGTLFPFEYNGIVEIPVSLPQDHQLLRVAGLAPDVSVNLLLRLSQWIRSVGGPCILLVHPDYDLAQKENLADYKRLLENFTRDPNCQIMTLGELTDWWKYRASASWKTSQDGVELVVPNVSNESHELVVELVTGYGSNGFTTEPLQ